MPNRIGPGGPFLVAPLSSDVNPDQPALNRKWLSIVLASWVTVSTPVWQTFQIPDQAPPPLERVWLPTVLASWEPDQQPVQKRRFAPQVSAQVDNPPFGAKNYQSTRLWEPDSWPAQKQKTQVQAASADQPFGAYPWLLIEWVDEDVPQQARRFIPQAGAVITDQPFSRNWLSTVQSSWEPEGRQPDRRQFTPQITDNPPPTSRPWLQSVLSSWEVSWTAQSAHVTPQVAPSQVDNPPFGLRPYLTWLLPTWETTWNAQFRAPIGWLPDGPTPPVTATTIYPIAMFPIGMGWR